MFFEMWNKTWNMYSQTLVVNNVKWHQNYTVSQKNVPLLFFQ